MDHTRTSDFLDPLRGAESQQLRLSSVLDEIPAQRGRTAARTMGRRSALTAPRLPIVSCGKILFLDGATVETSRTAIGEDGQHYRYYLHRRWGGKGNTVLWVILNPVAPRHGVHDSIIDRLTMWSARWGHNGLVAVSLYPCCVRSVGDAMAWRDAAIDTPIWDHVAEGARIAGWKADKEKCVRRVAAWGRLDPRAREDLYNWLKIFDSKAPNECLGVCDGTGDPLHPGARGPARPMPDALAQPFAYPLPEAEDEPVAAAG